MSTIKRFVMKGVDQLVAEKLVVAGFLTPKSIKSATKKSLKDAGLTDSKIKKLYEQLRIDK